MSISLRVVLVGAILVTTMSAQPIPHTAAQPLSEVRNAADQGNASAQFNLGVMYADGQGVPQDHGEAAKWYRKAADQGNASAQFNLGVVYANGQGAPQDYGEAAKWYRKAADQGNASAQFNLGVVYANGQGAPQDYVLAYMWINLAAAASTDTEKKVAEARDSIASKMTPEQVADAQRLAREWKPITSK